MINKDQIITVVDSKSLPFNDIASYLQNNFLLQIQQTVQLSDVAGDFIVSSITSEQKEEIKKYFFLKITK